MPVKLDAKMSRKAAVITGNVSDKRGTSHAYVVFQDETAAIAALASNMHMVSLEPFIQPASCKHVTGLAFLKTPFCEHAQHQPNMQYHTVTVSPNLGIASVTQTKTLTAHVQHRHCEQCLTCLWFVGICFMSVFWTSAEMSQLRMCL